MATKVTKNGKTRWFARVQKGGNIRTKLCKTRAEALAWEAEQKAADWSKTDMDSLTVHDWATKYLDHAKQRFTGNTYVEKRSAFKRLLKSVDSSMLTRDLTVAQMLEHLKVQFQGRSGYAANRDRKNLTAAWNWGHKYLGLPMPNPVALVEKFPEQRKPRYVPPEEDFWKVFDLAEGQDKVMLAVAFYTAARRGEIYRLAWEDVDWSNKRVRLSTRKRQDGSMEYDWLPMAEDLRAHMRWWWEHRTFKDSPWVFVSENEMAAHAELLGQPFTTRRTFMPSLCKRAGVKPFGFHGIRHLAASILYKEGYPVSQMQVILRHQSPTTTTEYLRTLGLEEVRGAVASLGRRRADVIDLETRSRKAK
ncbi:MAG: site-specific integrase [Desulfarculaceae bacterium]|nr:site-specific integrase [Desulfarculaceae bacterium]MCF8102128.1 site-specific integrase [Desulfarculaceae bacterium]MCF8118327.1 site-specific integrase [Desulfarculaceae bacterium]